MHSKDFSKWYMSHLWKVPESYSEDLKILFTNLASNYGHVVKNKGEKVIILNFSIVPL